MRGSGRRVLRMAGTVAEPIHSFPDRTSELACGVSEAGVLKSIRTNFNRFPGPIHYGGDVNREVMG